MNGSVRTVPGLRFIIRQFSETDAPALAALFAESVKEIGSRDYSHEQISAWVRAPVDPELFRNRAADGRVTLVAERDGGGIIAFGDIEADGHIDLLYCAPQAAGRGVTAELYAEIEGVARKQGISRVVREQRDWG